MSQRIMDIMRAVSEGLRIPVIVLLLAMIAAAIVLLGMLIAEYFTEHRKLKVNMPKLVDALRSCSSMEDCILGGGLIRSQADALIELTKHPDLTDDMRQALAVRLLEEESSRFEKRVMITDILAKLGPMLGLLGTLIPLGPGIIALGQGDTTILSQSLLTAFDTTILGLAGAAVFMIISSIRKRWYKNYMSVLETLAECVLEVERDGR